MIRGVALGLVCGVVLAGSALAAPGRGLVVGSKNFTEGVVLGELIRAMAASTGARVEHRQALGGTRLVFNALVSGEIDVYAEYTGTLTHEILARRRQGLRPVFYYRACRSSDPRLPGHAARGCPLET